MKFSYTHFTHFNMKIDHHCWRAAYFSVKFSRQAFCRWINIRPAVVAEHSNISIKIFEERQRKFSLKTRVRIFHRLEWKIFLENLLGFFGWIVRRKFAHRSEFEILFCSLTRTVGAVSGVERDFYRKKNSVNFFCERILHVICWFLEDGGNLWLMSQW